MAVTNSKDGRREVSCVPNEREASRRRFIGGAGLLTVAAVAPLASAAKQMKLPAVSPRLRRIIALHDRAEAASTNHYELVERPAQEMWQAAMKAHPVEPPAPHEESSTTFVNLEGDTVRLSTQKDWLVGPARRVATDPTWADMGDEDWRQAHRELAKAFDRRDATVAAQKSRRKIFKDEARARFRIDAINTRGEALGDRRYRLWQAALAAPAAGLADVVAKLNFSRRVDGGDEVDIDVFNAISADVRRLAELEAR